MAKNQIKIHEVVAFGSTEMQITACTKFTMQEWTPTKEKFI